MSLAGGPGYQKDPAFLESPPVGFASNARLTLTSFSIYSDG
jgi:hypothetical protein